MYIGRESETVEFKLSTSEVHAAVETMAAMLNKSGGGTIYFGVDDHGIVKGQQITDSTHKTVTDMVMRDLEPKVIPSLEVVTYVDDNNHNLEVLKLIFSGDQAPYSAFGRFLTRVGTQNRQMTRNELRRLFFDEDYSCHWDRELSEYTSKDIDNESLRLYFEEAVACGRLSLPSYDKEAVLTAIEAKKGGFLFNGAYAMFGKHPNVGLKLAVYATDQKLTFLDLDLRKGNIFKLQNEAIQYISKNIRWRAEIKEKRTDIPEIPMEAIREAVTNAFAHALYLSYPEIEINIYPSSVTITNPGTFPEQLTPMDYVRKQVSSLKRNPLVLDLLFRCRGAEKNGTGFKRIAAACDDSGVSWDTERTPYNFTVIFYRVNPSYLSAEWYKRLDAASKSVVKTLYEDDSLDLSQIADKSGLSLRTAQRTLAALCEKGVLLRVGSKRVGHWEISKNLL